LCWSVNVWIAARRRGGAATLRSVQRARSDARP